MRSPPLRPSETDIRYLIILQIAGQTHRIGSQAWDTPDGVRIDGGLEDLSCEATLDFLAVSTSTRRGQMSLYLPIDLAYLRSQGHRLAGGSAEIAITTTTRTYAERVTLLLGVVELPEYGAVGEAITLTISALPLRSASQYPPPQARIYAETWPDAADSAQGAVYPTVIGRPAINPAFGTSYPGSHAYLCAYDPGAGNTSLILVAGHATGPAYAVSGSLSGISTLSGGATGQYVTITDVTTSVSSEREIYHVADGLGRIVAVVVSSALGGGGTLDPVDGTHTYLVSWLSPTYTDAYGLAALDGGRLRTPSQLSEWALSQAGGTVDRDGGGLLDHLQIDTVIESRVDLVGWLGDLLDLLPVSVSSSRAGLMLEVWDPLRLQSGRSLVDGIDCQRSGRISEDGEAVSSVSLTYCRSAESGQVTALASLGSEQSAWGHGDGIAMDLTTNMIADGTTAAWIVAEALRVRRDRQRRLTVHGGRNLAGVRAGEILSFASADLWVDARVVVTRVAYGLDYIGLDLLW